MCDWLIGHRKQLEATKVNQHILPELVKPAKVPTSIIFSHTGFTKNCHPQNQTVLYRMVRQMLKTIPEV